MMAVLSLSNVQASSDYALQHANPLPNLIRVSMENAKVLGLNETQVNALQAWSHENKEKMINLIKQVISEEVMLHEEALTTDKDVVEKAETMLNTRREIIKLKTRCRANLKTILTEKQYTELIAIYRKSK